MAVENLGKQYYQHNPNFTSAGAGNTPGNPGSGQIIFDGTDLKINVAAPGATPDWKTITIT